MKINMRIGVSKNKSVRQGVKAMASETPEVCKMCTLWIDDIFVCFHCEHNLRNRTTRAKK